MQVAEHLPRQPQLKYKKECLRRQTNSPFGPVAPQGAGPLSCFGARLARGEHLQERKGRAPYPLLRARNQPPHFHNTPNWQAPTLILHTNHIPPNARRTVTQACPHCRRRYAASRNSPAPLHLRRKGFPPSSTSPHVDWRSLTPHPEKETSFPLPINGTLHPCRHRLRP